MQRSATRRVCETRPRAVRWGPMQRTERTGMQWSYGARAAQALAAKRLEPGGQQPGPTGAQGAIGPSGFCPVEVPRQVPAEPELRANVRKHRCDFCLQTPPSASLLFRTVTVRRVQHRPPPSGSLREYMAHLLYKWLNYYVRMCKDVVWALHERFPLGFPR